VIYLYIDAMTVPRYGRQCLHSAEDISPIIASNQYLDASPRRPPRVRALENNPFSGLNIKTHEQSTPDYCYAFSLSYNPIIAAPHSCKSILRGVAPGIACSSVPVDRQLRGVGSLLCRAAKHYPVEVRVLRTNTTIRREDSESATPGLTPGNSPGQLSYTKSPLSPYPVLQMPITSPTNTIVSSGRLAFMVAFSQ
jgi:hypothetical protein